MTSPPPYIELHAHSAFSFLDGASTPLELAGAAATLGYPAMALTDHDGIWGSMEFAHSAKGLGLRPITGAELTLRPGPDVGGPKTRHIGKFSARQHRGSVGDLDGGAVDGDAGEPADAGIRDADCEMRAALFEQDWLTTVVGARTQRLIHGALLIAACALLDCWTAG